MTPKEKAKELILKFEYPSEHSKGNIWAKQCALICVYEILNDNPNIYDSNRLNYKYWQEVKQEINKL